MTGPARWPASTRKDLLFFEACFPSLGYGRWAHFVALGRGTRLGSDGSLVSLRRRSVDGTQIGGGYP